MDGNVKKVFQKRFYDLLSHKYGILMILGGCILLTVSAFHFGEAWLEWSHEKYEAVFNSFSDNIVGKSFRERLSLPVPIDVVYTWVNGSDPIMLQQLEAIKMDRAKKSNVTRQQGKTGEEKCTYTNCLPIGIVVFPALPSSLSMTDLTAIDEHFSNVTSMNNLPDGPMVVANFTLIALPIEGAISHLVKKYSNGWAYEGLNHTVKAAFYTSDSKLSHAFSMPGLVMISGYPRQYITSEMQKTVATHLGMADKADTLNVKLYIEKGIAIVQTADETMLASLLKDTNFTIENKILKMSSVNLVWDLMAAPHVDEIADYRFQDKEELRYSLRSVEQYAPWVRHIYIVTNGQIPYWLNLDSPRISVITHEDIFLNASHLPTFSSPAIEANIHRIPGLSDKFLYLNDDVMFGEPVWPDDFYSHSTGHKLYLSWPVPNCNEGCPSTWINDGYCDKACNSSECEWDGEDCKGKDGRLQLGAGFQGGDNGLGVYGDVGYCQTGCSNNWLADKYCDHACNNLVCGFDAGDCGVDNFDQLYGLEFAPEKKEYHIPPGETMAFFNLTNFMGKDGKVMAATHEENKAVRTAAVGNKYKVLVLLLNKGYNHTGTNFSVQFKINANLTSKVNFSVTWDTFVEKKIQERKEEVAKNDTAAPRVTSNDELDAKAFMDTELEKRHPIPVMMKEPPQTADLVDFVKHHEKLIASKALKKELDVLHTDIMQGFLTEKGLKRRLNSLYEQFKVEMDSLRTQVERVKRDETKNASAIDLQMKTEGGRTEIKAGAPDGNKNMAPVGHQVVNPAVQKNKHFPKQEAINQGVPKIQGDLKNQNVPNEQVVPKYESVPKNQNVLKNGGDPKIKAVNHGLPKNPSVPESQSVPKNPDVPKRESVDRVIPQIQDVHGNQSPNANHQGVPAIKKNYLKDIPGHVNLRKDSPPGQATGRKLLGTSAKMAIKFRKFNRFKRKALQSNYESQQINVEQFIKLVRVENSDSYVHRLPWEEPLRKKGSLTIIQEGEKEKANDYAVNHRQSRRLMEAFPDSLRYVNRLYNKVFGYASRKVPAHIPHMIDKNIMMELQDRFPREWDATSSHKIRHSQDMQYAFAYYYYLAGVTEQTTTASIFNRMDTDKSKILSDREIRTLAAKLYDLPLYLETLTGLEKMFINCSQHLDDPDLELLTEDQREAYYDKEMPQVTMYLFTHCDAITKAVSEKFKSTFKYKTTIMDDSDVAFKIIRSNVSRVVGQLDDVRKNPKKFICLNDDMEHSIEEAVTVKAVLQDFYESVLPIPSQFELPREYRNRFLHIDELRQWRHYRDWLKFWTHTALIILVAMTIGSFLGDKINHLKKKISRKLDRRKRQKSIDTACSSSISSLNSSELPVWQNGLETV